MKQHRGLLGLCIGALFAAGNVCAQEIEVSGEGRAAVTSDIVSVQNAARESAKRAAVEAAMRKVLGPEVLDNPKVAPKVPNIVSQFESFKIDEKWKPSRIGNDYIMTLVLKFDDKKFRTLLSDEGVAVNTSTVRGATILTIMDEFFTTATNMRAPLLEVTEFNHKASGQFADKERASSEHKESEAARDKAAYRSTRAGSEKAAAYDAYGGRAASRQGYASDAGSRDKQYSHKESDKAQYARDTKAKFNESTSFRHVVKYQPPSTTPAKVNFTLNAMKAQFQDYDIKVLDNMLLRSKYFGNKPITLDQLENSAELARYVEAAKKDKSVNADFIMVGNTIITDDGKNPNTGQSICAGMVTVKTVSATTSEDIAAGSAAETASGINPDQCRTNVANKLSENLGRELSARIQNYWKKRNTYGQEYTVTLVGNLTMMTKSLFFNAFKKTPGFEDARQRSSSGNEYQVVVVYKGSDPIDMAVASTLMQYPAFANADSRVDGNNIIIDLDKSSGKKR